MHEFVIFFQDVPSRTSVQILGECLQLFFFRNLFVSFVEMFRKVPPEIFHKRPWRISHIVLRGIPQRFVFGFFQKYLRIFPWIRPKVLPEMFSVYPLKSYPFENFPKTIFENFSRGFFWNFSRRFQQFRWEWLREIFQIFLQKFHLIFHGNLLEVPMRIFQEIYGDSQDAPILHISRTLEISLDVYVEFSLLLLTEISPKISLRISI